MMIKAFIMYDKAKQAEKKAINFKAQMPAGFIVSYSAACKGSAGCFKNHESRKWLHALKLAVLLPMLVGPCTLDSFINFYNLQEQK
jgi:hypothetical protein